MSNHNTTRKINSKKDMNGSNHKNNNINNNNSISANEVILLLCKIFLLLITCLLMVIFVVVVIHYCLFVASSSAEKSTTVAASAIASARRTTTVVVPSSSHATFQYPIFVVGLPRAGSLAIHNFFNCHNNKNSKKRPFSSSHYCCDTAAVAPEDEMLSGKSSSVLRTSFPCLNTEESRTTVKTCGECILSNMKKYSILQQQRQKDGDISNDDDSAKDIFENCGNYNVWSSFDVETNDPFAWFLPQHFSLPLIHQAYPNATFILNTRQDPKRWAKSMLHWYSKSTRFLNTFPMGSLVVNPTKEIPSNDDGNDQQVSSRSRRLTRKYLNLPKGTTKNNNKKTKGVHKKKGLTKKKTNPKQKERSLARATTNAAAAIIPPAPTKEQLIKDMQQSLDQRIYNETHYEEMLIHFMKIHNNHVHKVRQFINRYPSHSFLQFNVDDDNAGQILAQTFNHHWTTTSSTVNNNGIYNYFKKFLSPQIYQWYQSLYPNYKKSTGENHDDIIFTSDCWDWNPKSVDDDWQDFSFSF